MRLNEITEEASIEKDEETKSSSDTRGVTTLRGLGNEVGERKILREAQNKTKTKRKQNKTREIIGKPGSQVTEKVSLSNTTSRSSKGRRRKQEPLRVMRSLITVLVAKNQCGKV